MRRCEPAAFPSGAPGHPVGPLSIPICLALQQPLRFTRSLWPVHRLWSFPSGQSAAYEDDEFPLDGWYGRPAVDHFHQVLQSIPSGRFQSVDALLCSNPVNLWHALVEPLASPPVGVQQALPSGNTSQLDVPSATFGSCDGSFLCNVFTWRLVIVGSRDIYQP